MGEEEAEGGGSARRRSFATCVLFRVSLTRSGATKVLTNARVPTQVPAALKRKGGKRESAHHLLSPAEALLFNVDDGTNRSKSSSKDKDKGREKPNLGPAAASRDGRWRRATGVLRDDGYFRVFADVRGSPYPDSSP